MKRKKKKGFRQPVKVTEDRLIGATPPEFHNGTHAYFSAKKIGLGGIMPAITINGRTLALPR